MNSKRPRTKPERHLSNTTVNLGDRGFNFLEQLIAFCILEDPVVPKESGIKFRISRKDGEAGVVILARTDQDDSPLTGEGVRRPDYLAVYLHHNGCICTIIEMKGGAGLVHGIKQINSLADVLNQELKKHLPPNFRMGIQGILLCPYNSNVPHLALKASTTQIMVAQYDKCAELFPYISKLFQPNERFKIVPRLPGPRSTIERLFSAHGGKCRKRETAVPVNDGNGLNIIFPQGKDTPEVTLTNHRTRCVFRVRETGSEFLEALKKDIKASGLQDKFDVQEVITEAGEQSG